MKRLRRLVLWLICLGVVLAPLDAGAGMELNPADRPAALTVLQSDAQRIVLELSTPSYTIQPDKIGAVAIQRIIVPGLLQSDQPGMPQLPTIGRLVAVPADAEVQLSVLVDRNQALAGTFLLPLGPQPDPISQDIQPGKYQSPLPATDIAPEHLAQGYLPSNPVQIAEDFWLRDQRMLRIAFSPIQYDPSSGKILWHRLLQVEITFTGQSGAEKRVASDDLIFEPVYRQAMLNYDAGLAMRAKAPSPLAPAINSREASTATRYRIVVDHPGLYRLTYDDLQAAGMPVDQVDPRDFQMTNQGRDVAVQVKGELDGIFDPGDEIIFYGEAFHGDVMANRYASEDDSWGYYNGWQAQLTPDYFERYTAENVYWLWVQTTAPTSRMPAPISGAPDGTGTVPQVFTDTVRAEESHRYWSFHFTSQDPWVWDDIPVTSITTHTYTTTLTGLAPGMYPATLQGEMLSNRYSSGTPDHHTWFTINDSPQIFANQTWDGPIRQPFSASIPQSMLRAGSNQLHLTAQTTAALSADRITFDWFSIEYARLFQADSDQLIFEWDEAGGEWEYHISNFSSLDTLVFDISDPLNPQPIDQSTKRIYHNVYLPLVSQNSGGSSPLRLEPANVPDRTNAVELVFQASHPGQARYLALAATATQSPILISAYTPPDLYATSNGADYIIIAPSAFITTSQTLADYRAKQGLRTMVVDVQDIYNEFNDGIYHPLAIKRFLSYAYQYWQAPGLSYVLLVGDGHWNFKGYTGKTDSGSYAYVNSTIYMPPYMAWVDPWQGEVDSSSLLATVAGTDIIPDLAIGRLPVNSIDQLQTVIAKTIAYESTPGQPWQRRMLFAADDPDTAGDFNALSDLVISESTPPDFSIDQVYLTSFSGTPLEKGLKAAYAITSTLNTTGTLFLNYIGHAAISRWAAEGMLITTGDPALANLPKYNYVVTLDNGSQLPVLVSMDCLDGYWNYATAEYTSLAEEMLRAPGKGSVAAFSPTGLGVASGHDVLNRAFFSAIFDGGVQQLGPASMLSKIVLYATGAHNDLIDTFTVFGDPALRMLASVAPAHAAQIVPWDNLAIYSLQVTNTEVYTATPTADTFTLSAQGNSWPVDFSSNDLSLLPGATATVQVTVTVPASAPLSVDQAEIVVTSSRLLGKPIAVSTLVTTAGPPP